MQYFKTKDKQLTQFSATYEGWNFNSGNYLFTTDTKKYTFRSFTVLQCSHQHCVQPVASDVEVVG